MGLLESQVIEFLSMLFFPLTVLKEWFEPLAEEKGGERQATKN